MGTGDKGGRGDRGGNGRGRRDGAADATATGARVTGTAGRSDRDPDRERSGTSSE